MMMRPNEPFPIAFVWSAVIVEWIGEEQVGRPLSEACVEVEIPPCVARPNEFLEWKRVQQPDITKEVMPVC